MHFITLDICACTLLLSSIVTITILLRKQFRQWKNTSLYVLSMSDVLFSAFTCTILFMNCVEQITGDENSYLIIDGAWSVKSKSRDFNASNPNESNIHECSIMNAIIKYGMLFLPFTNSFVSLLMFSVECNLSVYNLENKCKSLQSEENVRDATENLKRGRRIPSIEGCMKNSLQAFKRSKTKRGIAFVLGQWIVPVLVTGLLYLANFDKEAKEAEKCLTDGVFLFDDCINARPMIISQDTASTINEKPVYTDYIDKEDLKLKQSNSTQVNEIIVRIQNLVYSLMNDSSTISFDRISFNSSEASNSTNYLELDTYTILLEQNKSTEHELDLNNSSWTGDEYAGNLMNVQENVNSTSYNYTSVDDEYSFFNNLMRNVSTYVQEENYNNEITTDIVDKLDIDESQTTENIDDSMDTTVKYDALGMSSDQIYAEILKRIHGMPAQNKYKHKDYYNKKQPKEFHGTALDQYLSSNLDVTVHKQDNSSKVYVMDNCLVSVQFLRVHLLLLVFVIYFLPILFSSILQQRGKLMCKIILEKLEARDRVARSNFMYDVNDASYELSTDSRGPSTSGQDLKHPGKGSVDSKLQFVDTHDEDCDESWDKYRRESVSFEDQPSLVDQIENMSKLFDTIRNSSLCGILLWTPLFLEFLIKVFASLHAPEWLLNVTYLTATMFGTLRNVFNLRMIKCQRADVGVTKMNSVHPAKRRVIPPA